MVGFKEVAMTRTLFLIAFVAVSGCASIADYRFRASTEHKARLAWHACKSNVHVADRTADFAGGFKSGFVDVSRGGDGASPVVPPQCYWDAKFQTAEGKMRIEHWYSGFALGAATACQCGANQSNNVPSR